MVTELNHTFQGARLMHNPRARIGINTDRK